MRERGEEGEVRYSGGKWVGKGGQTMERWERKGLKDYVGKQKPVKR